MTLRRLIAALLIVLLAVLLVLASALWLALDTGAARTWAETAVERATGHELRIAGRIHVAPSLVPTLAVADVALLNPPGFSRSDLAHARWVEAQVALLPLLRGRIEVQHLHFVGLDTKLEVNAAGHGNWESPPAPVTTPAVPGGHRRFAVVLQRIEVDDSVLAWSGPGGPMSIAIPRLSADGTNTLKLAGTLQVGAAPLQVQGSVGAAAPWPTYVALTGQGVSLALNAQGGVGGTPPQASIAGKLNPAALDPRLTMLGEVKLDAAWTSGTAHLRADAAPFSIRSGLRVEQLALDAPALEQPVRARAVLTGAVQLSLSAETGPPAAMLAGMPLPVAVAAWGQGGKAQVTGTLGNPKALRGLDAALSAQIGDLAALAPGVPPLHDAALTAHLTDPAGLARGVAIQDLSFSAPKSDLTGNLAVSWQPRPALRGALASKHLDGDALLALFREHSAPEPTAPQPAPAPAARRTRVIPDTPLPVSGLRAADADISYTADALQVGGTEFHAVQTHVGLANGALRLDPLTAALPGGPVQARAMLDGATSPARVSLSLHAPSLDLAGLLPGAAGTVALNADLDGKGTTLRQVAASLGGEADLTGVNGQLNLDALAPLREAVQRAGVPVSVSGQAQLRCVALRAAAASGVATLDPVVLDAGRFGLHGNGRADLSSETLDMHLRALVRLGPADAEVPLHVTGTFAAPKVAVEAVGGRFGLMAAGRARHDCGPALAEARGGHPGPEPAPSPNPPPASGRAERPADLLRSLLR